MSSPMETIVSSEMDDTKKTLFKIAMKGQWKKVVGIYKDHPEVHEAKITKSGDTALHIAVSDGREDIVKDLVTIIRMDRIEEYERRSISNPDSAPKYKALKVKNDRGNTPLHLAAVMGNARMCDCIADVDPELVGARNEDSETPFFLAALHGKTDAFLCLHDICDRNNNKGESYSRRKDGDTILHCAISGEYFDLAFQIILRYENLVDSVNEQGFTPLHLLASKPSAFKSGSHLAGFHKIIYHCIFVDELKRVERAEKDSKGEKEPNYPENYQTCIKFFRLPPKMIRVLAKKDAKGGGVQANAQNQEAGAELGGMTSEDQENYYQSCFHFFQMLRNMIRGGTTKKGGDIENPKDKNPGTTKEGGDIENPRDKNPGTTKKGADIENPRDKNPGTTKKGADIENPRDKNPGNQSTNGSQGRQLFPSNYDTCYESIKLVSKAMLVILGFGSRAIEKLKNKKEKHTWSVQIMNKLLETSHMYEVENEGKNPGRPLPELDPTEAEGQQHGEDLGKPKFQLQLTAFGDWLYQGGSSGRWVQLPNENIEKKILNLGIVEEEKKGLEMTKRETAILIAAKNGVREMVEKILELFPVAIHDMNSDKKNVVLLAVENRQPHVYQLLVERNVLKDSVLHTVDGKGNSALHLAATLGLYTPWLIPGAALQMQWEIKWYEFVKNSMPRHFFVRYNKEGKTPKDVFTETHRDLVKTGGEWLSATSNSCSVVAALIATVAFATSTTVPGGTKQDLGTPTLEDKPAFNVFAISSLIALCFSVTALVMFLSILTSRYQERDFGKDLPRKLLVGLSSLFVSIASMLISFCAGHFFVLKDKLKYAAFPVYAVTCLPVTFFAVAQFPLYFDLIRATFKKVPQRSYQVVPL